MCIYIYVYICIYIYIYIYMSKFSKKCHILILGAEIGGAMKRFYLPLLIKIPATMRQSAQTTITSNYHKTYFIYA